MNIESIYYNTAKLTGDELLKAMATAKSQETKMLAFFAREHKLDRKHHDKFGYSRSEIHKSIMQQSPEHSVQRAISNLTKQGYLIKSDETEREGSYGVNVHVWRFNPLEGQTELFKR